MIRNLEGEVRSAVETAIRGGYQIISKDWGVVWDTEKKAWVSDTDLSLTPSCCPLGAYFLAAQPQVPFDKHLGDLFDAAVMAWDLDKFWLRDFLNGTDGYPFVGDAENRSVYEMGARIANTYFPLDIECIELQDRPS